jgi:hypothetical protein
LTGDEGSREAWERDERARHLVELAPDAILLHDGERIVLANAAALRLAGATHRAELVGLPIDCFLDPPHFKAIQAQLTDADSGAELAAPVRDTFRRLDGSEVPVEVRAVAFMDHGRPSAHLVIRDITERLAAEQTARRMEERLQLAQRMETVGALAGGMAHEVNNMMAVVLAAGDFLLQNFRLPAECLGDVREIIKAADRAAAVTRQLLAFGRRAAHRPRNVDLGALVRDVEPVIRRLLGEARPLAVAAEVAPRVWVDPGQLEQVLVNLILNARDATPPGGTVSIIIAEATLPDTAAGVQDTVVPTGRYAALIVRDTGTGMDAATQARIFEPFFTTKPVGEGTGLGLAAAHGIVTQNNGHIMVASAPGQGATFTVYLPALPAADVVEPAQDRAPPAFGADAAHAGATVLVVEDESTLRSIIARGLERGGFRVLQAKDGGDALELIDRHGPPHLVLTDVLMPGIGGPELARRLSERWPLLPVLFMSGYSAQELGLRGAISAERQLIQKPFTIGGLVESVTLALSGVEAG